MTRNQISASKTISYALRHKPQEFNLSLDEEGWVDIDTFCLALQKHKPSLVITRKGIEDIIAASEKKRFEIEGNRIRATYGHSFEAKIEFTPHEPPLFLYHGTSKRAFAKIEMEGLKPMSRQYVHLSKDFETAQKVGSRHDKNTVIILRIDTRRMYEDGFKFFHSVNDGTWMCECVPSKYFQSMVQINA